MSKSRYPPLRRPVDSKAFSLCRGCGKEVMPPRYSWCSKECYERYDPAHVYERVKARDHGRCQMCGCDVLADAKEYDELFDFWMSEWFKCNPEVYGGVKGILYGQRHDEHKSRFVKLFGLRPSFEFDHIKPFSEGGATVDENMRLLCTGCHRKRTREWHQQRAAERRGQMMLPLERKP